MNPMPTGLTLDSVGKRTIEQQNDAKEERRGEKRGESGMLELTGK